VSAPRAAGQRQLRAEPAGVEPRPRENGTPRRQRRRRQPRERPPARVPLLRVQQRERDAHPGARPRPARHQQRFHRRAGVPVPPLPGLVQGALQPGAARDADPLGEQRGSAAAADAGGPEPLAEPGVAHPHAQQLGRRPQPDRVAHLRVFQGLGQAGEGRGCRDDVARQRGQ
jgi:hypothetical protein